MSKIIAGILLASALAVSAAPSFAQEFAAYEGKQAFAEGDGGSKKAVEGIDFWTDGSPPRKFKLLGYITDTRYKTGLIGMISMSKLDGSVAEVAKKNGGTAVVLMTSKAETVGWDTGTAIQKQHSKYAVLKYLSDEESAAIRQVEPVQAPAVPTVVTNDLPGVETMSTGAMAEWVKMGETESTESFFDPTTIRKDGDFRRVWTLLSLNLQTQSEKDGVMSRQTLLEFDCKELRLRILSVTKHSGRLTSGGVLSTDSSRGEWVYIPPRSGGNALMTNVCAK